MKRFFLKLFRSTVKNPLLESLLITQTDGKRRNHFWTKLLPRREQYLPHEYREATRDGIKYRLYLNDYDDYMLYFKVKAEKREYYELVKNGTIVFDIGTNIGMSLLNFAKRNKDGMNYGFEPIPETYNRAKFNVEQNFNKHIKLNNLALSDRKEKLAFTVPVTGAKKNIVHSGGAFLSKSQVPNENTVFVEATTLDAYCEENNITKIDFMKIDVEGFEMFMLKGSKKTLQDLKPIVYVELNDEALKRQGNKPEDIIAFLQSIGYKVVSYPNAKLLENMTNFTNCYFDVLCTPA